MFKKIMLLNILLILSLVTYATAGPFGLEIGMSLGQIENDSIKVSHGKYKISNIPKPHSAFETYIVQATPKSGLCWIKAIGIDINTSTHGVEIKSEFRDMKKRLEEIYGKYKIIDILLPGSIWNEPNDWMMGLIKKERFLGAIWEEGEGSTLPNDLKQVGLIASAINSNKGFISIEYSFANIDDCEAELSAIEDEAL